MKTLNKPSRNDSRATPESAWVCFYEGSGHRGFKSVLIWLYRVLTGARFVHVNIAAHDGQWLQCSVPGHCEIVAHDRWQHEPDVTILVFQSIDRSAFTESSHSTLWRAILSVLLGESVGGTVNCVTATARSLGIDRPLLTPDDLYDYLMSHESQAAAVEGA